MGLMPRACSWGEHPKAVALGPRLYNIMIPPLSPPEQLPVLLPLLPEGIRRADPTDLKRLAKGHRKDGSVQGPGFPQVAGRREYPQ
jgi:hypothetical protein